MKLYYRNVDAGHGRQCVLVSHGKIMEQWLEADSGHYTGSGNPEWIGQKNIGKLLKELTATLLFLKPILINLISFTPTLLPTKSN